MTVIVAYADGIRTWIGSDLAVVCTSGRIWETGKKWSGAHGWWFGHCGDHRAADIIEANSDRLFNDLRAPEFANRLAGLYEEHGMKPYFAQGETVPDWNNSGLLACAGRAWDVDGCLSMSPCPINKVFARGSAGHHAMAAAWGYQRALPSALPSTLIEIALEAAAHFDVHIRGAWQHLVDPESQ
jgi:hypothetical protein